MSLSPLWQFSVASCFLHQSLYGRGALRVNRWSSWTNWLVIESPGDRESIVGIAEDRQAHGEGPQIDLQFKLSFSGRRLWIWFDRQEAQKKSQWSCFRLSHSLVLLLLHLAILCIIIIICPSDMRFSVNLWPLKTSALLTREIMSLSLLGPTGGHEIKHPSTHTRGL